MYTISFRGHLYALSSLNYNAEATFRGGVVFLDASHAEVSRDTSMVVEHLSSDFGSSGGAHTYDCQTEPFWIPSEAQYVKIYAHVNAWHTALNPQRFAQAGAMLDCFYLRRYPQLTSVDPKPWDKERESSLNVQCLPNPFRSGVEISFDVREAGPVEVWIYDLAGRLVHRYGPEHALPGRKTVLWDGRNYSAKSVPSGVYACRVVVNHRDDYVKLVLAR
jgi:hypothetical protein